ncbi:MAG: DNA repair protein RecO [Luteolibacter sp.]
MESACGTIIRLTRLTDSSLIVHWFCEQHGLLKTVAKAARKPKGPFAGKIDLFYCGEFVFQRARRGSLHALREVSIHHWREGLRSDYSRTLLAAYFGLMIEKAVEPEHPDHQLHDLLSRALDHVETAGASLRALHHFEREMLRALGLANERRPIEESLQEAVGRLPENRSELLERL